MKTIGYINNTKFVIHWGFDLWWVSKKYYGQVIFNRILVRFSPTHPRAIDRIAHEIVHVEQWRTYWYVGFLPVWLWRNITQGYKGNQMEVEARHAGGEAIAAAELAVSRARAQAQRQPL